MRSLSDFNQFEYPVDLSVTEKLDHLCGRLAESKIAFRLEKAVG